MPAIWNPKNDTPLIEAQEDERNIRAEISVTEDQETEETEVLSHLHWSAEPAFPPQTEVTVSGDTIQIHFPHFGGLWPIEVNYLDAGEIKRANTWDAIPEKTGEIIAYRKPPNNRRQHNFTITAEFTSGVYEQQTYQILLHANYTPGRDALKEALDARRHPTR